MDLKIRKQTWKKRTKKVEKNVKINRPIFKAILLFIMQINTQIIQALFWPFQFNEKILKWKMNSNYNSNLSTIFPDSWVDLGGQIISTSSPISLSGAVTPTRRLTGGNPFGGEHDYLRMLREAQRESNR